MAGEGAHKIPQSPRGYGQMDKLHGDGNVQPGLSPIPRNGGIHETKPNLDITSRHNTETQVTTSTGDTDKVIYLYACILQDWPSLTPNKAEFLSKITQFHERITNLPSFLIVKIWEHETHLASLSSLFNEKYCHTFDFLSFLTRSRAIFSVKTQKTSRWAHLFIFQQIRYYRPPPPLINPLYFWQHLHNTRSEPEFL